MFADNMFVYLRLIFDFWISENRHKNNMNEGVRFQQLFNINKIQHTRTDVYTLF